MCIGVPMQVVTSGLASALCRARNGEEQQVDTLLVGDVAPGTWLMVFLGGAREVISEETAMQTADALDALSMAMRGEGGFEHLFADLIDREPELPDFLKPAAEAEHRDSPGASANNSNQAMGE